MGERWLVTGATGFLGAHLVEAVLEAGHEPVLAGRGSGRSVEFLSRSLPFLPLDLGDPKTLIALPARLEALGAAPRIAIHAAAISRGAACREDPERARRVNAEGPSALRAALGPGLRFVQVSTDLVWGRAPCPPGGFDATGTLEPEPIDVYAATKLAGEQADRETAALDRPAPRALTLRLPLLYGNSRGRCQGASDGLLASLEAGEVPTLFRDEWRTPLEVRAAARAIVELAISPLEGVVHLGGPERIDRAELGRRVLEQVGWRGPRPRIGSRLDFAHERPADTSLDSSVAQAQLSFALPDVDAGLAAWARERLA